MRARLPGGEEVLLRLEFLRTGTWGTPLAGELQRYLATPDAAAGGSLMVRVSDGEARRCELWLEGPARREDQAIGERNRQLADAALALLRMGASRELQTWVLIFAPLVRGVYRHEVAPDPLEGVLRADRRIAYLGLDGWLAAEAVTPELRVVMRRRPLMQGDLYQPRAAVQTILGELANIPGLRAALERILRENTAVRQRRGLTTSRRSLPSCKRSWLLAQGRAAAVGTIGLRRGNDGRLRRLDRLHGIAGGRNCPAARKPAPQVQKGPTTLSGSSSSPPGR